MEVAERDMMALRLENEPAGSIIDDLDGVREVWHDVLPLLDAAATELTLGDLLHGEGFHLQEAMSALEMGDPQMDSMASTEPEDDPAPSLPPDTISAADLVGVLDDMLCCEHAWYGSSPLVHSLFRLDWLHAIPEIRPLELRAPLLAAVKSAAAVRALVLRGDVAEEEDFVPNVSGLNLQEHTSEVEVSKQLMAAEEATQLRVKAAKDREAAPGGEAGGEARGEAEAPEALEAVLSRLRFRRGLLTALTAMLRPNAKAAELARKMLTFATTQLASMRASEPLGTPRDALGCFDGRASKKLMGSAPQRKPPLLPRADAFTAAEALLSRLRAVCAVSDVVEYDGLLGWLASVAGPKACVLTRSCSQLLGVAEERGGPPLRPPMAPMAWEAVRNFAGLSPEAWKAIGEQEETHELQHQLAQAVLVRMRLNCLNGARHRRRLRHFLHDWAPLQPMCDACDEALQEKGLLERGVQPLGAWALGQTLDAMSLYLRLGFELDLFSPCEFQMNYWYLDCICGMRLQLHEASQRSAHTQALAALEAAPKKAANKKKAKPTKPPSAGSAATRAELQMVVVRRDLCRALALLIASLRQESLLDYGPPNFMPLQRRFEKRFQVFLSLHRPTPLPWSHFEQLCDTQLDVTPPAELKESVLAFLKSAKGAIEQATQQPAVSPLAEAQAAELKALLRVTITNTIFTTSLPATPPPGKAVKISFSAHPHFPVFSLVDAKH